MGVPVGCSLEVGATTVRPVRSRVSRCVGVKCLIGFWISNCIMTSEPAMTCSPDYTNKHDNGELCSVQISANDVYPQICVEHKYERQIAGGALFLSSVPLLALSLTIVLMTFQTNELLVYCVNFQQTLVVFAAFTSRASADNRLLRRAISSWRN